MPKYNSRYASYLTPHERASEEIHGDYIYHFDYRFVPCGSPSHKMLKITEPLDNLSVYRYRDFEIFWNFHLSTGRVLEAERLDGKKIITPRCRSLEEMATALDKLIS